MKRALRKAIDYAAYLAARVLLCAVQSLSLETCAAVARGLSFLASDILRLRESTIDEGLRLAFPESTPHDRRSIARQMWEHLFLMCFEVALLPRKLHLTNWRKWIDVERERQIVDYLLQDRSCVVVSGHFGNFEAAGYMLALLGFPTFTIARTLDNPYLDRYLNQFRSAQGQFILPKQGSAAQVDAVIAAGKTLVLLGDQYAGPKGCWVEFFGRPASYHKAIALFTLSAGAPMMVGYMRRRNRPMQFVMGAAGFADPQIGGAELESVKTLTRWYNDHLEELIRRHPAQYWWLHRRWKGQPATRAARESLRTDPPAQRPVGGNHHSAQAAEVRSE